MGNYKLLGEIAHGGMGVVYKAHDQDARRCVALKVILSGPFSKSQELQRFRREVQACARLDHPNIVPIYYVGEQDGWPFFSMKLIEGGNLEQRLREGRWDPGENQPKDKPAACPPRLAAKLMATISRAVHYAHQRGILHRDLKPANILVDQNLEPYVTDFGLAKLVATERVTKTLASVGTPSYMAPEQIEGPSEEITTAADVYSLGAILYEVLTSRAPFRGHSEVETLRHVLDQEPAEPHVFNPTVDKDLETICLKCLAKQPVCRYPSAQDLAQDLERWLRGEPIEALPVTRMEKLWRWSRRQPVLASVSSAFVLFVICSLAVILWQWQVAKSQAAKNQEVARSLLDVVKQVEAVSTEDVAVLRKFLAQSASTLDTSLSKQPQFYAEMLGAIGQVYGRLGDFQEAEVMFNQAVALRQNLHPGDDRATAQALNDLASALWHQGKVNKAEQVAREGLEMRRRLRGENDLEMAESLLCIGEVFTIAQNLGEAKDAFDQALQIRKSRLGSGHPDTADALKAVGKVLRMQGHWPEAEALFNQASNIYSASLGPRNWKIGSLLDELAQVFLAQHRHVEAENAARRAFVILSDAFGPEHVHTAEALTFLAVALKEQNKLQEAEPMAYKAWQIRKKRSDYNQPGQSEASSLLLDFLISQGKYEEAETLFAPENPNGTPDVRVLRSHANFRARTGRWPDAAADFQTVIQLEPGNHEDYHALAPLLVQEGDIDGYYKLCEAIKIRFAGITNNPSLADRMAKDCFLLPSPHTDLAIPVKMANLAVSLDQPPGSKPWLQFCKGFADYRQGHYASSSEWLRKALEHEGERFYRDIAAFMVLAMADHQLKENVKASAEFAKGLAIAEKSLPTLKNGPLDTSWIDWIFCQVLTREAQSMIQPDSNTTSRLPSPGLP